MTFVVTYAALCGGEEWRAAVRDSIPWALGEVDLSDDVVIRSPSQRSVVIIGLVRCRHLIDGAGLEF
jgi:hypothetical protein